MISDILLVRDSKETGLENCTVIRMPDIALDQ
jgi:hypothetical protein